MGNSILLVAERGRRFSRGAVIVKRTAVFSVCLAVATTGIAGPGGGTEDKPVGTVWFAIAKKDGEVRTAHRLLRGGRARIRTLAAYVALELVRRAASDAPAATSQPD